MTEPVSPTLTPAESGAVGVLPALTQAMRSLTAVGKDSFQSHQNYNYRSADAVINAVFPVFAEHGLVLVPAVAPELEVVAGGKISRLVIVFTVYHSDGSSISGQVVTLAQGVTPQAPGAAMSYGLKYFLSALLMIPFDDPRMDFDSDEHKAHVEANTTEWWQDRGWGSEQEHGQARQRILAAMKAMPAAHQRATKLKFAEMHNSDGTALWVPNQVGKPAEKGTLAAELDKRLVLAAEAWLETRADLMAAEADGEEPFPIDGEAGE